MLTIPTTMHEHTATEEFQALMRRRVESVTIKLCIIITRVILNGVYNASLFLHRSFNTCCLVSRSSSLAEFLGFSGI